MGLTVNTGDFPDVRDSASDVRQIKNSAEDGANRSLGVFQHTTCYPVDPISRIFVELWIRERTSELEQENNKKWK